ncbi:MAG: hypothetical protein ACYC9M_00975 [Desulfobulbaceae bacterium]
MSADTPVLNGGTGKGRINGTCFNGEPRAVLQDPESYDNMRKAIGLLKLISLGEEDIKQGNIKTQDKVFKDIETMLTKKDK